MQKISINLYENNSGDIDIELWSKKYPLSCRNFIQLRMECCYKNYDISSGGFVTGADEGNSSIHTASFQILLPTQQTFFQNQFHRRLKCIYRCPVGIANGNTENMMEILQNFIVLIFVKSNNARMI
ncbi:hypothetical protein X798_05218 [Onchocerca flexuosa]|uniref:PPIase cyclophilin-type domain-containing protein n=1 Tax=Onchocerca flexuosa TaxID=387005 RepID=A0A238BQS8_9BILA|nr:hypothetical protein X798_05218 [Onchocerca flexuosa]